MASDASIQVGPELAGKTLAAVVRLSAGGSWSEVRKLVLARRVRVNGSLCLDDARRLNQGEFIEVLGKPAPPIPRERDVRIVYADADLVVVDKPAGVMTLRRGEERGWSERRKERQPTLDELVNRLLPARTRPVHRLDRDTSGLILFALSERAEHALIRLFARHRIERVYQAVAHGRVPAMTVRDRGDGLRGSTPDGPSRGDAERAVTHVRPVESIRDGYTLVECRLETGRTHQIRIHLAERGHVLCGEKMYVRPTPGAAAVEDRSGAPRQALHSAELWFVHPVNGERMRFTSPLPRDLAVWLERLRAVK
jgi:23S rRNA pseudouridine1911/1915/1917 synthase